MSRELDRVFLENIHLVMNIGGEEFQAYDKNIKRHGVALSYPS